MKTLFALNSLELPSPKGIVKQIRTLSSCGLAAMFIMVGTVEAHTGFAIDVAGLVGGMQSHTVEQEVIEQNKVKAFDRSEILWFARAVHSETDRPSEKAFVAWTIRNRVENKWYPETYESVVLQPYQFSGLNDFDNHYERNMTRDYDTEDAGWQQTLEVATDIYYANASERLLSAGVMHFYSPVAIEMPDWAQGLRPAKELYGSGGVRFAFYHGVK